MIRLSLGILMLLLIKQVIEAILYTLKGRREEGPPSRPLARRSHVEEAASCCSSWIVNWLTLVLMVTSSVVSAAAVASVVVVSRRSWLSS